MSFDFKTGKSNQIKELFLSKALMLITLVEVIIERSIIGVISERHWMAADVPKASCVCACE